MLFSFFLLFFFFFFLIFLVFFVVFFWRIAVHFQKIIHRDIKPENILLNANDEIQLADFGVAHIFDGEDWLNNSQGSPAYSPPEVCASTSTFFIGVIFSLNLLLFSLSISERGQIPREGR